MPTRKVRQPDRDMLWGFSCARCAFPGCKKQLVAEATHADPARPTGVICHIVAYADSGPRGDPKLSAAQRNGFENLILLCADHHTVVDKQPNTYTAEDLRTWKRQLMEWVRDRLVEEMPGVSSAELEVVCEAIVAAPCPPDLDFRALDPSDKMRINALTDRVRFLLEMGLAKAREVAQFVEDVGALSPEFPEKLKAGFVEEYKRLKAQGFAGDSLFEKLRDFSARGFTDFKHQAAGLAVLAYLFEKCEVFER